MRYIKGTDRDQISMLPMCIDDFIADENPVRVIDAFVDSLDLEKAGFARSVPARTGRPAYDPKDLLKLYCYGYRHNIRSSRRLEEETHRNLEVLWLLGGLKPDHKTISDFRKDNKVALKNAFRQLVLLCRDWGLFGAELVAVDGTKIRASNSRRASISPRKLDKQIQHAEERINAYLEQLDSNDANEPDSPKLSKEEIQERIAQLKERKAGYQQLKQEMQEKGLNEISKTDPDARRMSVSNNGVDVSHNVQIAVDGKHSLVVDFDVTSNVTDHGYLSIMAENVMEILDVESIEVLADKGYYAADDLVRCEEIGATPYVPKQKITNSKGFSAEEFHYNESDDSYTCPAGQTLYPGRLRDKGKYRTYKNARACRTCELRDQCTSSWNGRTVIRHFAKKLLDEIDKRTSEQKDKYQQRQLIVEHPIGTIKRSFGLAHFLTRGNSAVRAESSLAFLAYNMLRAINILGVKEILRRLAVV